MPVFWPLQVAPGSLALVEAPEEAAPDAKLLDLRLLRPLVSPRALRLLPPLTSAAVVCRASPWIEALPHVARLVSEFLDTTKRWSLLRVCEGVRSVHLLRRVHALEQHADAPIDRIHQDWVFNQCVNRAAAAGALDVVKWLATEFSPGNLVLEGATVAAANGQLDVLQWLVQEYGCVLRNEDDELAAAAKNGHERTARWLLSLRPAEQRSLTVPEWQSMTDHYLFSDDMYATESLEYLQWVAAECGTHRMNWGLGANVNAGRLNVVQWLAQYMDRLCHEQEASGRSTSEIPFGFPVNLMVNAGGDEGTLDEITMDCVRWVFEQQYDWLVLSISVPTMNAIAATGRLDDFAWLHSNIDGSCSKEAMARAAGGGHLEMIKWLHKNVTSGLGKSRSCMLPWDASNPYSSSVTTNAAANGHLHVLRWLHDNTTDDKWTYSAMDTASANGHVEVVRWLHENRREGCTCAAMDKAAENGHLEVVEFLHSNRSEGCSTRAMDGAAANNHLQIVIWLHTHRAEGCTTAAMDRAAVSGHLEVVKWLHEHRSEGCTTIAMGGAIVCENLEMVQWLHENRSEAIPRNVIDTAAGRGNLEIVRWLSLHARPRDNSGCTTAAMDDAASKGHLDVVRWLHENRSEGCTTGAMNHAAGSGHFDVVLFLHANRREGCSMFAFIFAFEANHLEILRWLVYNYPLVHSRQLLLSRRHGRQKDYMNQWITDGCLKVG